eukprot:TRINITY_DN13320_c0_g3_i2.p1 TRINITY_DN13320_c0_g3~~TRINITY_DN13320_c0_g3_i2.p1  ORF type:complete len:580 (+),score=121.11 TRINITY_DN13320_c0_g3_i2:73-1812(+)
MIDYEEDLLIALIPRLKGSVFQRSCYFAAPAAFISFACVLVDLHFAPGFLTKLGVRDMTESQLWSASTGILFILLSFRTNRAMARFWEGTGLLHQMRGEWFDSVSCCVTFSRAACKSKPAEVEAFRHTIVRLMSLCHGSALEEIAGDKSESIATIDSLGLDNATLNHLQICKDVHDFNRVEVLLHLIQSLITVSLDDGILKIPPPILSRVYQTLSRGFVNLLNAKKIADTRFPFPYAQLIAGLLLINVFVMPVILAALLTHPVWCPLFTFMATFGMSALNFVGVELENPFGDDDNDLPLDHFQSEMNKCLLMLLQDNADLIPGVSKTRCVTNFAELVERMSAGVGRFTSEFGLHRISDFGSESSGDKTVVAAVTTDAPVKSPVEEKPPEVVAPPPPPEPPLQVPVPAPTIAAPLHAAPAADASKQAMGDSADEGGSQLERLLPGKGGTRVHAQDVMAWSPYSQMPCDQGDLAWDSHVLAARIQFEASQENEVGDVPEEGTFGEAIVSSIDNFTGSLDKWAYLVKDHVMRLNKSFSALQELSSATVSLLDSMQRGHSKSSWGKRLQEERLMKTVQSLHMM